MPLVHTVISIHLNKSLLFILLVIAGAKALAQTNYVPNGSFEVSRNRSPYITAAKPWRGMNTVDYYRHPYAGDSSEFKGARTGKCYIGMRFQSDYKEFIYVKLTEPLKKGQVYEYEMYLRVAPWSTVTLRSWGVHFSRSGYKLTDVLTPANHRDTVERTGLATPDGNWFRVSGTFTAQGGEKVMTIGNYAKKIKKDMEKPHFFFFGFKEAYYFVDDVALYREGERPGQDTLAPVAVNAETEEESVDSSVALAVGEVIRLDNILFETGRSELLPASHVELNRLVELLNENPTMEIRISGHTDNKGKPEKNMLLSEQRAKAVYEYLMSKGVKNRVEFKGFGSTKPIAPNDTESGRRQNRRVEFEVLKQ